MDHLRLSDDRPIPDSVTSLYPADSFLLTPCNHEETTLNKFPTQRGPDSGSLRLKTSFQRFERPSLIRIAILTVLCLVAYPALYVVSLVGRDLPLFTVRVIVGVGCSGIGFALSYSLLGIGVRHIEAATWATLIQRGYEDDGMKLGDLAQSSADPTSILSIVRIFLCRFRSRKTTRGSRGSDDRRPWSLFIGFFMVLAILGPVLPFIFGRIMSIETYISNQNTIYREVLIAGDLSPGDVERAVSQPGAFTFKTFGKTWALLPYGMTPPDYVELAYGNDTVYFTKPSLSQFTPGGSGLGSFDANRTSSPKPVRNDIKLVLSPRTPTGDSPNNDMGAVIRYPQWGVRVHCKKLPDPKINLIPFSNESFTFTFIPQDLLQGLFAGYGMDLPASLKKPDLRRLDKNTIPSEIDPSKVSYLIKWSQNGVAHSFNSHPIPDTDAVSNQGWTSVETLLIQLNTRFTPSGRFPVYSNVTDMRVGSTRVESTIGYDAAVCVERYEPWIIEAYNTSVGFPTWTIMRVVEKGYGNTPLPSGQIQGDSIPNTRYLNTTGKDPAFYMLHDNNINEMVKANGQGSPYTPALIGVSFTDGVGPQGYTELTPDRVAVIRARASAANILPYLAGSAPVVAQSYPAQTLAYVTFVQWQLIGLLVFVLILGIIGELFVPKLPRNMPRRGFGMYSWLALFRSQEFRFEDDHDLNQMSLEQLEKEFRNVEAKFVE